MVDVRGKAILIVDDEAPVRELLSAVVRRQGMRPITASDGHEALTALAAHGSIVLVILDLRMPNMDGAALCRALRSNPRHALLPILMVSGDADLEQRAADAGATATLPKPFTVRALATRLVELLPEPVGATRGQTASDG